MGRCWIGDLVSNGEYFAEHGEIKVILWEDQIHMTLL